MTALRTERLELRPFAANEADELLALFNDPDVGRWLLDGERVPRPWVDEEIGASERRFRENGCGLWAVRVLGAPDIIGFAGFRPFFEPPELQLLYGLLPAWWGRGVAREAASRVIEHCFGELGLTEVVAATDRPNAASVRVLEALGFQRWKETDDGPAGTLFFRLRSGPPGALRETAGDSG